MRNIFVWSRTESGIEMGRLFANRAAKAGARTSGGILLPGFPFGKGSFREFRRSQDSYYGCDCGERSLLESFPSLSFPGTLAASSESITRALAALTQTLVLKRHLHQSPPQRMGAPSCQCPPGPGWSSIGQPISDSGLTFASSRKRNAIVQAACAHQVHRDRDAALT
jgi:hypothetical protein